VRLYTCTPKAQTLIKRQITREYVFNAHLFGPFTGQDMEHSPINCSNQSICLLTKMCRNITRLLPFVKIEGVVEHGFGRGSKTIGFATANLNSSTSSSVQQFLSSDTCKDGIYIGWVGLPNEKGVFKAAISVGNNPTFEDSTVRLLEAHLLDYTGPDFYDVHIRVLLCAFIRGSSKFNSIDELTSAISTDCEYARNWLTTESDLLEARKDPFLILDS
jgi:FAD synthase